MLGGIRSIIDVANKQSYSVVEFSHTNENLNIGYPFPRSATMEFVESMKHFIYAGAFVLYRLGGNANPTLNKGVEMKPEY